MKLRIQVDGLRRVLLVSGVALLGYCAYTLADAWWFQHQTSAAFPSVAVALPVVQASVSAPPAAPADGVIGRLEVNRLGLSVMVLEGTSAKTLKRAAGHIAGTALPGQPGNVGISGHRDTFFFPLRNIRQDDELHLTTRTAEFRYRVVSVAVVQPTDTDVLAVSDTEVLTLVTCYPFTFIGPAPERYIVRARRIL
jgi:sortase A